MAAESWTSEALAAALVASIALPVSSASAWCQMTTSGRRPGPDEGCVLADPPTSFPLRWERRCTSMSLSTSGSSTMSADEVTAVLRGAISTWTSVTCDGVPVGLDVQVLAETNACDRATHLTGDRNVHSLIFVQDGWVDERLHDPRAYAVTLVWHDPRGGEIWDADIEINELRGPYGVCPDEGCPDGLVDLPNVLTHEMGHYFGLAHTPHDALATMWSVAEPDETLKRDLREDDIEGLCSIYPPGSLPEECDHTPRGGLGLDCRRHGECDCSAPGASRGASPFGALVVVTALGVLALARRRR